MDFLRGRFIYNGIHEKINSKIAVMELLMKFEEVHKELVTMLAESPSLRARFGAFEAGLAGRGVMRLDFFEEDLAVLFDELMRWDFSKNPKKRAQFMKKYIEPIRILKKDSQAIDLDFTYYAAYGIATNEKCREKLEELVSNKEEYWVYWSASRYIDGHLETEVPADWIWDYRLLIGMIEKLRKEAYRGKTYQLFYQILYAGNRYWKRQLKKQEWLTPDYIRKTMLDDINGRNNLLQMQCQTMILFLMANDMEIPIVWDGKLMSILELFDEFEEECSKTEDKTENKKSDREKEEENEDKKSDREKKKKNEDKKSDREGEKKNEDKKQKEDEEQEKTGHFKKCVIGFGEYADVESFFKAFDKKHKVHNSLPDIIMSGVEKEEVRPIFWAMNLFEIGLRKYEFYKLTKEECEELITVCRDWDHTKYRYFLTIAVLSKYIQHLEQMYIGDSKNAIMWKSWQKQQEEVQREQQEQQYENEWKRALSEKKQLEDTLLSQELQIAKLKKQLEISEAQLQEYTQELSALRSYVYLMHDEHEDGGDKSADAPFDLNKIIEAWKERKVLVLGGHNNWQSKLKELFPKWQFLSPRQSAQIGNVIAGKEIILCNTGFLDHPSYYKMISAKGKQQKLFYVHSNNVEKCLVELEAQLY